MINCRSTAISVNLFSSSERVRIEAEYLLRLNSSEYDSFESFGVQFNRWTSLVGFTIRQKSMSSFLEAGS